MPDWIFYAIAFLALYAWEKWRDIDDKENDIVSAYRAEDKKKFYLEYNRLNKNGGGFVKVPSDMTSTEIIDYLQPNRTTFREVLEKREQRREER